jgi:hypothetical protein
MSRSAACLLAVAFLVAAGCDDATQPTPSPGQVAVTTNKTHYAPQEPILVTVSNRGESPVWLWLYGCLPSFEQRLMGGWEPEHITVCPAGWSYFQLDPGQSLETNPEMLPSGQYRILAHSFDSPGCAYEDLCDMRQPDVHRSLPIDVD